MIDEDVMQDMDKNEGDDRATKNDPRSIKVLVTDHTNEEKLDDNGMQPRSKEASRVMTPIVTWEIGCSDHPPINQTRSRLWMAKGKNSPDISTRRP